MRYLLTLGLLLAIFPISKTPSKAQASTALAARMVTLKPKDGMQRQFEEGYKRHLEWHRQNKDKWTWYGWQVIAGDRLGYFVDGTFGHRWEEFDAAVAPAGDAADNALNVSPYADFLSLSHYLLRPEISRGNLLEDRAPSALIELLYYRLYPGKETEFESVLQKVHEAYGKEKQPRRYTWYKLVSGGEQPTYLLMLPLTKLADFQMVEQSFTAILAKGYAEREAKLLLNTLQASVREVRSEALRYRSDLSYLPPKE